ncbi:Flavodoxin [Aeromicrobium choanae]|uniref:Flavodoxin n=1 Tax=Aeromicrobium choanae TaxID=1736691 RepID=A0A1T4Z4B6_9ACTN|nr:Flavodoxin [Aeromicrobium choanae]
MLVAYFSRAGENYSYGDRVWLETGNTEVAVRMIADTIDCDVHRIEAADPYPREYDPTVARNSREQDDDARPEMAGASPDLTGYDVVILASPIWGSRAPMIMSTFTEALDFTGKTVHPFTTHAMSGLGSTERDYAETCRGAEFGEGLAVQGETVRDARPEIEDWLKQAGLMS